MIKEKKAELQSEIGELLESSSALYFADFQGLTVEQVNALRSDFYGAKVKYKVVKNTLFLRALEASGKFSSFREQLDSVLKGPTGVVFATDDPVSPAKIIKKHFDKLEKPKLKSAIIESEVYDAKSLNALASMQTKPELISGILSSLDSPASGLVGVLNAVMRDLSSVIEEVAKKQAA
ncbi:50S ribosomal protein L10 [soil metagenome]